MKFHLYSALYGDHYINLFKRACFKSLNWPKNQAALKGSTWNIYTKKEHFPQFEEIFKDSVFNLQFFEIGESIRVAGCGMIPFAQCDSGVVLLDGLRQQIYYSMKEKSKMLLAPPDTVFGDGTIPNLLKLGEGPGTCVSVAHPRVLPGILDEIEYASATSGAISNAKLVTMAFEHAHDAWKLADINHPENNSFIGGIAWKKLDENLWSVQHRLPTVYLASFNELDWDFFWSQVSWGGWDHRWPAENLMRQERQRYAGSSDACFIAEITDWDKNVPPKVHQNVRTFVQSTDEKDLYGMHHYHNGINRQTNVIFRGE